MRDIEPGEELTYDYSTTMNDDEAALVRSGYEKWTCACHCGAETCRGIIDQFKTLPKATRDYYISNKFAPDFILRAFASAKEASMK